LIDASVTFEAANEVIRMASNGLPLAQRSDLQTRLASLVANLEDVYLSRVGNVDVNFAGLISSVTWHVGALLGFDTNGGYEERQLKAWALADLSSTKDVFRRKFPDLFSDTDGNGLLT
jgi:hypothetical protein